MWVKRFENMYCNNQVTVHIVFNPVFHEKISILRLIVILFVIRSRRGLLLLRLCPLEHNLLADMFIKTLCKSWLELLCDMLDPPIFTFQLEGEC